MCLPLSVIIWVESLWRLLYWRMPCCTYLSILTFPYSSKWQINEMHCHLHKKENRLPVKCLVNYWTSLILDGILILMMVWHLPRFSSIPFMFNINPRNLSSCIPKEHLVGFKWCYTSWLILGCLCGLQHGFTLIMSSQSYHQCRLPSSTLSNMRIQHPLAFARWCMHSWVQKAWHCSSNCHDCTWTLSWVYLRDPHLYHCSLSSYP